MKVFSTDKGFIFESGNYHTGRWRDFKGCHRCGQRTDQGPPYIDQLHVMNVGCRIGHEILFCTSCASDFYESTDLLLAMLYTIEEQNEFTWNEFGFKWVLPDEEE